MSPSTKIFLEKGICYPRWKTGNGQNVYLLDGPWATLALLGECFYIGYRNASVGWLLLVLGWAVVQKCKVKILAGGMR